MSDALGAKAARPRVVWRKDHYEILRPGDPLQLEDTDELERLETQVRTTVANVDALAKQLDVMAARIGEVVALVELAARSHAMFAGDISRLSEVLKMPVVPLYDKNGKVAATVRVEKLPEGLK